MTGTFIEFDDAFTPTEAKFREGETELAVYVDGESVRFYVQKDKLTVATIRLPLWASVALAQLFTGTLNGQRLLK